MKALDRKLLRDLWTIRAQALTIALVVASGLAGFVGSLSTVESLVESRDRYYASARLADVFSSVKRAPEHVGARLADLPDVAEVQTELVFGAQIALAGVSQPMTGRMVGVGTGQWGAGLNRLSLRAGRWPAAGTDEVLVNEAFAIARGLGPGATVSALLNGKRRTLQVVGIALSPEYVFAAATGGTNDDTSFGVYWIDRERLEAAFDMDGAFNAVSVKLRAGASVPAAIEEIDRLLAPYGSRGGYGRDEQPSHRAVAQEIREQRVFGILLPSVFLAVAVFILNVVLGRQVTTQRDQIAALKALGYENRRIAAHYLKLAAAIVVLGLLLGVGIGDWLGRYLTRMYSDFFRFPQFHYASAPWTIACGASAFVVAALGGAWLAVRRLVSLAPAEALRPPAPPRFGPLLLERAGLQTRIGPQRRMILRNVERRPVRAAMTTAGIASAVAILIGGTWWRDALDYIIDVQFANAQPGEVYVAFTDPLARRVEHDLAAAPGVLRAEVRRSVPVRIHAGHLSYRATLSGLEPGAQLWRLIDAQARPIPAPAGGILMTDRLAEILRVRPGDTVRLEFLEGRQRSPELLVGGLSREPMGLGAYMPADALDALAGEGRLASAAGLMIDDGRREELFEALKRMPRVAGVFVKSALVDYFRSTSARNILVFTTVLTAFAAAIAVGVVYNSARIALAERAWELATLRVLGLSHREVTVLLLAELATELVIAIPLGFVGGYHLAELMIAMMSSETVRIPAVILPRTYAYAGLTMLGAGVVSAWMVQRRLARLDLVAVLKTRE